MVGTRATNEAVNNRKSRRMSQKQELEEILAGAPPEVYELLDKVRATLWDWYDKHIRTSVNGRDDYETEEENVVSEEMQQERRRKGFKGPKMPGKGGGGGKKVPDIDVPPVDDDSAEGFFDTIANVVQGIASAIVGWFSSESEESSSSSS